jgi:hypothetical protein
VLEGIDRIMEGSWRNEFAIILPPGHHSRSRSRVNGFLYSIYKIREIKKLQDKGFSKITIEKIENKNTFKTSYERFYKIKKNSIITSRFLISIQTSIPSIIRSSKTTICSFYSFQFHKTNPKAKILS